MYIQGIIKADPSKVGAVSFVSGLWSDSVIAEVLICLSFLYRGIHVVSSFFFDKKGAIIKLCNMYAGNSSETKAPDQIQVGF